MISYRGTAPAKKSLTSLDVRPLEWLLHYPLQRIEDLVIASSRWASRATVYRRLWELYTQGYIERALLPSLGTGASLYYLSNLGLHTLAAQMQASPKALARAWRADSQGLFQLLPRLTTLFAVQNMVNGLVSHAADALTCQGRRPTLVRWDWQRDLTYRFGYREKSNRFFSDSVCALCVRERHADGLEVDRWYGLLILMTDLNDERLMRSRLAHILYWRESAERWPLYTHMPPVLILARSARQSECWQQAASEAARHLQVDPVQGVVTCLPSDVRGSLNPWLLTWRTLVTNTSCHLQNLLIPLPPAAIPLPLEEEAGSIGDDRKQGTAQKLSHERDTGQAARTPRKRRLVCNLATVLHTPCNTHSSDAQTSQETLQELAIMSAHMTARGWTILRLLLEHPLLSREELSDLMRVAHTSTSCYLSELRQLRCVAWMDTIMGRRYHLTEQGLRLVAAANHLDVRNLTVLDASGSALEQRGLEGLLHFIRHTAGIYSFFAALARASEKHPDQQLLWWETGASCERRYDFGEHRWNFRPDALAEVQVSDQRSRFWLEWDCGTMNTRDLIKKVNTYAQYIASREWAREGRNLPLLLFVAPDLAQEKRIQRVVRAVLAKTAGLVVRTTMASRLEEQGLCGAIWRRVIPLLQAKSGAENPSRSIPF